jgi:hypothetical protein
MSMTFARDPKPLLAFAAVLEGCSYYYCKDDLKREYVPTASKASWQDAQILEIQFGDALRPPTDVDPRRFALVRYNVDFVPVGYYCNFEVCYRELETVEMIPESISWDPAEPEVVRLHFSAPIPASACDPFKGNRSDFQALELLYLGAESESDSDTETGGLVAEPDELAYENDQPVEALGHEKILQKLESCVNEEFCEFDDFCIRRGGYIDDGVAGELRVDCPEPD